MVQDVIDIMFELEIRLLEDMTRLLMKGSSGSNLDLIEFKAQKLAELGRLQRFNSTLISKSITSAIIAAQEEIVERGKIEASEIKGIVGKEISALTQSNLVNLWARYEKIVEIQYKNMGSTILQKAGIVYQDILDRSLAQTLLGQVSVREAIAKTATEWGKVGLKPFLDAKGREWSVEATAQMSIRTQIRAVTTDTQLETIQGYGIDLVEISSHIGARPKCEPYQGKIYSIGGISGLYPPLSSTSIGEIDGLFGVNCGHQLFPYTPGTPRSYEIYGKKENEGVYKESQKQRRNERQIRNAKRELQTAKASGVKKEIDRAQEKLNNRLKKQKEFLSTTGRTRREGREEIYN